MFLKILAHPVFANLNFHMPMIVDLSHPLIMLTGENGCGKSTLLQAIYYAMRGDEVDGYVYKLEEARVMRTGCCSSTRNSIIRARTSSCSTASRK